jgi:hypothetical protein
LRFDASALRKTSDVDISIPWKARDVTLIRLERDGRVTQAGTVTEKRAALQDASPEDCLLLAWPGSYRQDIFLIDDRATALQAIG